MVCFLSKWLQPFVFDGSVLILCCASFRELGSAAFLNHLKQAGVAWTTAKDMADYQVRVLSHGGQTN